MNLDQIQVNFCSVEKHVWLVVFSFLKSVFRGLVLS